MNGFSLLFNFSPPLMLGVIKITLSLFMQTRSEDMSLEAKKIS